MEIIETRKAIIELIEPYMDKTLSEWCLVKIKQIKNYYEYRYTLCAVDCDLLNELKNIEKWDTENTDDIIDYTIIWHYDITAVLKYISKKIPVISIGDERIHSHLYKDWIWRSDVNIPNKPIHLYSEQEEKDLLELLLKLKQYAR